MKDEYCSWNNDTFTLKVEGGKAIITSGASAVDFSLDICTLAAIYTGFWNLEDAFEYGKIQDISRGDVQRFEPLFVERIPHLINFF